MRLRLTVFASFLAGISLTVPGTAQTDPQRRAMESELMARNPDCIVSMRSIASGRIWGLTDRIFVVTYDLGSCRGGATAVAVFAETAGRPRFIPSAQIGSPSADQIVFPTIDAVQIEEGRLTVVAGSTASSIPGAAPWKRRFRFGVKDGRIAELGSKKID